MLYLSLCNTAGMWHIKVDSKLIPKDKNPILKSKNYKVYKL